MGANIKFSRMLATVTSEAPGKANPKRQVEVFTQGGKTFLRIGPVDIEHAGEGRATVEISALDAAQLVDAIRP
ncbi:hypothetical protein GNZ12_24255 [Paraburkholderia sp. 1N]|uniref:Uncharacterized protein n=1 Tax=Paraburkholderia solitsugae TaxID=2675748 RepID=A0ABX2BXR4_9BURK|nr:hypothetical protein [Paraburkholderia solitsugae]NPT44367.1 hypothetical protein [Paraburkholderia solitsugae]